MFVVILYKMCRLSSFFVVVALGERKVNHILLNVLMYKTCNKFINDDDDDNNNNFILDFEDIHEYSKICLALH